MRYVMFSIFISIIVKFEFQKHVAVAMDSFLDNVVSLIW